MTKDWLKIYHNYNKDLESIEILLVGEKSAKQYSSAFSLKELDAATLPKFLDSVNSGIEKYLELS